MRGLPVALMPTLVVACALLIVAGVGKARSPGRTREALRLVRVPVSDVTVRALGVAEIALGVVTLIRPGTVSCALVALVYAAFSGFIVLLLRSGSRPVGCGCFGDAESGAGHVHLVLNMAACAVAVVAALSPPRGVGWVFDRPPLIALSLVVGVAAATFAAYLAYTAFPVAWRVYGSGARV